MLIDVVNVETGDFHQVPFRYPPGESSHKKPRKTTNRSQARLMSKLLHKIESGERRVDVLELSELATIYRKPLGFFLP